MKPNGWDEYKKLILHEIQDNSKQIEKLTDLMNSMKSDIAALKVKAAVAGGIAGMVGTGIVTAIITAFK